MMLPEIPCEGWGNPHSENNEITQKQRSGEDRPQVVIAGPIGVHDGIPQIAAPIPGRRKATGKMDPAFPWILTG